MTLVTEPTAAVRTRHPLRAESVRGFAPFAGAGILLTLGAMLAGSSARWQGGWAETAAELHTAVLITARSPPPRAAGRAAGSGGGTPRNCGDGRTHTARAVPGVRPAGRRLGGGRLPGRSGFRDARHLALRPGRPAAPGPAAGDAVAVAAAALLGHVVGRVVPTRLAAPLLAMAGYVGLGMASTARSGSGIHLNPAFPVPSASLPVWWQPVAMALWTGGLAVAATLAYAARRRVKALVPLAVAVTAGALLAHTGNGLWHRDPLVHRQVCDTSTTPAVCVNARYAGMLPQVREALSGVTGKLKGVRNLPVRWADRGGAPVPTRPSCRPWRRSAGRWYGAG
ncbi:hypothetical protein O1M54_32260 [Streptomyces diastatochromogenes]|nr:hypothetical protein [Streptomyces diastatochromogenes]